MRAVAIMAGGSGERFWPVSRPDRPKQLLRLADPQRSLLAQAVDRLLPLVPAERVFVVTGRHLVEAVRAADVGVPPANVLGEPCKRNTLGCLVYAAAAVPARLGCSADALTLAAVTADHRIGDAGAFGRALAAAFEAAEREAALVTIGLQPTRPETGYGYLELPPGRQPEWVAATGDRVFAVQRFREKPDRATAEAFLADGQHLWNSGMFVWRLSAFSDELGAVAPPLAELARELAAALATADTRAAEAAFARLPDVSIDYALMEKARRVLTVAADFEWDDLGAWDALDRALPHDAAGNVTVGDAVLVDSRGCIVYGSPEAPRVPVAVVGCRDLVVVVDPAGVLVVPKARAQDARAVAAELRRRAAGQP